MISFYPPDLINRKILIVFIYILACSFKEDQLSDTTIAPLSMISIFAVADELYAVFGAGTEL